MLYPEGRTRRLRDAGQPRVDPAAVRRPPADFNAFYTFDAHYDVAAATAAERALQLRALLHLRPLSTLLAPALLALGWLTATLSDVAADWTDMLGAALALTLLVPLLGYVACVANARRRALRYPVRPIGIGLDGISVRTGTHQRFVPWRQIERVWRCGSFDMLILGRFTAIAIPAADLSPAARNVIVASVASAG